MSAREVKSRAAGGAVLFMGRGAALQGLRFLAMLVLARLLVPEDFGIVAVGLTVVNVGQLLAGAGLGSALVARERAPDRAELRALTGLQLLVSSAIAGLAAAVAAVIGDDALVTALMVAALPVRAFKTPAVLLFDRKLQFVAHVKVEIADTLVYVVVAVALAVAGLGAWSLAIAMVAASAGGTLTAIALSPLGFLVPSLRFSHVRSILGFGWRFQAVGGVQLAAETLLTAGIGALAGLGAVGLWSFASRLLAIPRLLFEAMWRVGFPAFSRLMQSGESPDMARLLERTVATFAVAVSALLCPLAASSPAAVPLVFGADWTDVSLILPGAALALAIGSPVGLVSSSYFYARGDATTGLVGVTITGVTRLAVTLSLLPSLGVTAIGIGWAAGAISSMFYTVPRARRASGARLVRRLAAPAASGILGGTAGWLVAEALGVTVASALLAALAASAVWTICMLALGRETLRDGIAMGRTVAGSAFERIRNRRDRAAAGAPAVAG
jgi:O-antigen/teichoic acid export membrane protein